MTCAPPQIWLSTSGGSDASLLNKLGGHVTSRSDNMASSISNEDFNHLQLLLKAPSKEVVKDICLQCHKCAHGRLIETTAETLNIPADQAAELTRSLQVLTRHVVFYELNTADQISSLFPDGFHSNLKNLLTRILLDSSPTWKSDALSDQISLPQLQQVDWSVSMVAGSDSIGRICAPTCLVKFQTNNSLASEEPVTTMVVELSRESLDTILDGLGRIRDQLSAVAAK
ncbi:COMM domain-containing protein 9 [Synchiropus splendidus]|uniref:COMM domain-containing protein 9 n=1 Tax=Synchiropus splendidus TaxID=270530 RepID=UPI00237E569F|nr:COMM domain-containing protein 9 [Synchiropus splendidus]